MARAIRLKHQNRNAVPKQTLYFYDGRAIVEYGIVTVPADKPAWLSRVYMLGFRLDPETGAPLEWSAIQRLAAGEPSPQPANVNVELVEDSAESTGEDSGQVEYPDERSDAGGQSPDADGVRESEFPRDEGVSEPELGSGVSDGTTEDGAGNDGTET